MAIDRRAVLRLLAGAAVPPLAFRAGTAACGAPLYLSACADASGAYRVSGFSVDGSSLLDLSLPGRGHSFAVRPCGRTAVHFARRPGRFALVLDLARGAIAHRVEAPDGRHFYGHGVFSQDGRLLYATENDFNGVRGVIGIYDGDDGYRRVGELSSGGIGPHEIALLSDGETLVVANGGVATHPDLPRVKLNLPAMTPSLCFVDRRSGALRRELTLDPALHQLGIRHLAVGPHDTVAVAMQYEGPARDCLPLVALQHGESRLRLLQGSCGVLRDMKNYCGSVCFDSGGRTIAVSAPRGNLVTFWDVGSGRHLASVRVNDGCGVAPGARCGEFLASSGQGGVVAISPQSGLTRPLALDGPGFVRWDNHLVAATGPEGAADSDSY